VRFGYCAVEAGADTTIGGFAPAQLTLPLLRPNIKPLLPLPRPPHRQRHRKQFFTKRHHFTPRI
jgi:hypothetical protein